ncbi:hypothetical protein [Paenibacillus xylanexedens]|uniref:hypothetical protein n=1 Tax=Paenibacillus xylanexedens TaxID=528191 RepID=UPI0011A84B0A|nr:hypothetical protein [Paenibacillus xylanexedens]
MSLQYTLDKNYCVVMDDENGKYRVYRIEESNIGDFQKVYQRYLSLLANEHDLSYSKAYIDQMMYSVDTSLIDGALINSAIQLLLKCFNNSGGQGRAQLDYKKVFDTFAISIGKPSYLKQYNQLRNIRNQTLAHDQNDFKDNRVGITVDTDKNELVEITHIKIRQRFLYKENANIIREMTVIALEFIKLQKQKIEIELINYYSRKPISEILQYKLLDYKDADSINAW